MIKRIPEWQETAYLECLPEQGRAIIWLDRTGKEIHGCVSYTPKRRCFGPPEMIPDWLPLRDDLCHTADVPIKYIPVVWRYVDDAGDQSRYSKAVSTDAETDQGTMPALATNVE